MIYPTNKLNLTHYMFVFFPHKGRHNAELPDSFRGAPITSQKNKHSHLRVHGVFTFGDNMHQYQGALTPLWNPAQSCHQLPMSNVQRCTLHLLPAMGRTLLML